MNHDDDLARLRRQLRAMAAVNEHLRVQLDALRAATGDVVADVPPPPARLRSAARRAEIAADWTPSLVAEAAEHRAEDPVVVMRADRAVYVVEGSTRRRLAVTLLAPALEQIYGARRLIDDDAFHQLTEGPPIEVLEGPTGPPFVVVGGRRLILRGVGLPHGVDQSVVDALPEGPPLDVATAVVPRRATVATEWVAPLADAPSTPGARLVTTPEGVAVVEGHLRRPVRAGLLLPALEVALGQHRPITTAELDELDEGPPVEVLEGRRGQPFVVVDGHRLPVIGLPLPHPIEHSRLDGLPEGPRLDLPAAVQSRRANAAGAWLSALTGPAPDRRPELVDSADGTAYVRDGDRFRPVTSGLLLAALDEQFGPRRPATEDEQAAWELGPPVEVLERTSGLPFVVIGAVRIPIRNLPLPNPVRASALDGLPEGPPVDITAPQRAALAAAKAARERSEQPDPAGELKALVGKEGVVRATAHLIRRRPDGP